MEGTVGQYRITGTIGRGGMGAVYAAQHTLLGRPAAIKVLLPALSHDEENVMRFFNEARAASAIQHPGIVEIYDFGWHDDHSAYIVMEHLQGETLGHRARRERFTWQRAFASARQIASALAAAHAKGIIHRDLKPENVFVIADPDVTGGERIKLLDFGVAKLGGELVSSASATETGAVIGTPMYMAPEQCRGVGVDHRADLYSLGCVVFELCAGRPPFLGQGAGDLLVAQIHNEPPLLGSFIPGLPEEVEALIQALLAKAPAARPQTADEVIFEIDEITSGRSHARVLIAKRTPVAEVSTGSSTMITPGASAAPTVLPTRLVERRRFRIALSALATIVVIVLVMIGVRSTSDDEGTPMVIPVMPVIAEQVLPLPPATAPPITVPPVPDVVELAVDSVPTGAQLSLDGAVLGSTPFRGTLPRADVEVTIVIKLANYAPKKLVLHPNQPITEHVKLVPLVSATTTTAAKPKPGRDQSVSPF